MSVAELPAALAAQHMPPGVSGPMLLTQITGANLPAAALVTLPNSSGLGACAMLSLVAFNPLTGGHDVVGKLVVSADGKTMTSIGPISLGSATPAGTPAAGRALARERRRRRAHLLHLPALLARGALATITDPVGLVTTLTYNSIGPSQHDHRSGRPRHDLHGRPHGNLTEIVDPTGAYDQYGYHSNHEATTETDPNGKTATAHYNSFGQLTSETLFDGTSTTSRRPAQSNGPGPRRQRLAVDRLRGERDRPQRPHDDADLQLDEPPDRRGRRQRRHHDHHVQPPWLPGHGDRPWPDRRPIPTTASGDVTSITEPYVAYPAALRAARPPRRSPTTTFGVPTSITDFNGNTTTFTLDSHGNVSQEDQPGGSTQEWTYNSAGQALTYTDGNGTTSYTYDSYGRLTTVTEPLPGSPTIEYGYDAAGDVTSVTDEVGDATT